MSEKPPGKVRKWLANLSWLGGPEGAALMALMLGLHFVIIRLLGLVRDR